MFSDSQAMALCSELNHILWTRDTPKPNAKLAAELSEVDLPMVGENMQCVAHAIICAALLVRQGENVTTRSGSALVVYPELPKRDNPHFIVAHWWITAPNGVCDFSLNLKGLSNHNPIIFRNSNIAAPKWKVFFKDNFQRILEEATKTHAAGESGVFYQTDNKINVGMDDLEADILKLFPAAETAGSPVRYLEIVLHCEALLKGGLSLRRMSQQAAWQFLADNRLR